MNKVSSSISAKRRFARGIANAGIYRETSSSLEKCLEWARRVSGLPQMNRAKSPISGLVTQAITAPVARQVVAQLSDTELNALYTAAITELLRRQRDTTRKRDVYPVNASIHDGRGDDDANG